MINNLSELFFLIVVWIFVFSFVYLFFLRVIVAFGFDFSTRRFYINSVGNNCESETSNFLFCYLNNIFYIRFDALFSRFRSFFINKKKILFVVLNF